MLPFVELRLRMEKVCYRALSHVSSGFGVQSTTGGFWQKKRQPSWDFRSSNPRQRAMAFKFFGRATTCMTVTHASVILCSSPTLQLSCSPRYFQYSPMACYFLDMAIGSVDFVDYCDVSCCSGDFSTYSTYSTILYNKYYGALYI